MIDVARPSIGMSVLPRVVHVRVHGDLDAAQAARLDRVLTAAVDQVVGAPGTRVLIDLEAVDVLAAAGMTVLLRARGAADRRGVDCVVCVSPRGRRTLALTGLDRVLLDRHPVPEPRRG